MLSFLVIFGFFLSFLAWRADAVNNYTLAGVFSHFTATGKSVPDQLEHVFAFKMAVDFVNNRKDLYPNIQLNYIIKNIYDHPSAVSVSENLIDNTLDLIGVVTTVNYDNILVQSEMLKDKRIVIMNSVVNELLTNGTMFKYVISMNPMVSYYGRVVQTKLCGLAREMLYVITTLPKHINFLNEMLEVGTACNINNLGAYVIKPGSTDFTSIISKVTDIRISMMTVIMEEADAALFLSQAYDQGLIRPGISIFLLKVDNQTAFFNGFPSTADIPSILYGSSKIEFLPKYYLTRSPQGLDFIKQWRSLPNSVDNCADYVDHANVSYLTNIKNVCYGLNFSSYDPSGSDMNPYVAYTYDAVIAFANGLLRTIKQRSTNIQGNLIRNAIIASNFTGVSGLVAFRTGDPSNYQYGRGNRVNGIALNFQNFQKQAYDVNSMQSFVGSFLFPSEGRVMYCQEITGTDFGPCASFISNNPLNLFDGYPPYTLQDLPNYIKIGGMFAPFDEYGNINQAQMEMLSAFILAVKMMNARDDILPNTQIIYELQLGSGFINTLSNAQNLVKAFYDTGVHAVVNGLTDTDALTSHSVFTNYGQIFQIDAIARDSKLSDALTIPYKAQIYPVYSFDGLALQSILCKTFGYKNIGVFYGDDANGVDGFSELTSGKVCDFQVIFKNQIVLIESSTETQPMYYTETIERAVEDGVRVLVFIAPGDETATWLYQAYIGGLITPETQIFVSSIEQSLLIPTLHKEIEASGDISDDEVHEIVMSIMKGVISVEYWSDGQFRQSDEGKAFMELWRQQPYTGPTYKNGRMTCNRATDDSSATFIYQSQDGSKCSGLNFTSYDDMLWDVTPDVIAVYDAVNAVANAIDIILQANPNSIEITGDQFRSSMIRNVTFDGLTGVINFYRGDVDNSYKHRGDIREGHVYKVLNFNEEAYLTNINESFVQIGIWKSPVAGQEATTPGIEACGIFSSSGCVQNDIVYRTATNEPPSDTRPDVIEPMPVAGVAVLMLVFAAGIIMTLIVMVLTYVHRRHKLIKAAQPEMLACILIGVVFGLLKVMIGALPITDSSCTAGLWMAHLAFTLGVGSLMIKTYRVHRVLNMKSLKRVKFTARKVLAMMAVVLLITVVWLIVLTAVSKPRLSYVSSTSDNQTTKLPQCSMDYPAIHTVMMLLEGLVVIVGGRLCYAIKDVPSALNESKNIAAAITFIGMISALVFPIVFLLGVDPSIRQIIASLSFGAATLFTMLVIFAPKIMDIRGENSKVVDILGMHKDKERVDPYKIDIPTANPSEKMGFDSTVAAMPLVKSLPREARTAFCMEQVQKWQAMMLNMNIQMDMSGSGASGLSAPNSLVNFGLMSKPGSIAEDVAQV